MSEDFDATIIQDYDAQSFMDKFKAHEDNDMVFDLTGDEDEVMVIDPSSKQPEGTNKPNDIQDILQQLTAKYKIHTERISDSEDEVDIVRPSKVKQKNAKAQAQLEKLQERQRKKEETERNKELKKVLAEASKSLKPDECVKFVTTEVDSTLMENHGNAVRDSVNALGANLEVKSQAVPKTVTWKRRTQSAEIGEDGKLRAHVSSTEENQLLLIMDASEVISLIAKQALLAHVIGIRSAFDDKRISLGLYGMRNYFERSKRHKGEVKRRDFEFALTELQLMCSCCYRLIDTPQDLGNMISQFTKAIAQAPYKLEKQEKYGQSEWYMSGDNKDCVRVDKDGNGLKRLWQQHLTSLPLVRIETAEAITNKYPTYEDLRQAYENCMDDDGERERMLQDLPIRRAAGPLTNVRRIGPELSRKISVLYNSSDPDALL